MKMISGKMIFFSVFGCIPENASENILLCCAKDRAEGAGGWGGEACVFGKMVYKKIGRKPFFKF